MDLNKTHIIGRLTKDAELTYTANGGVAILNFSIASDHMKKKDGSSDVSYFQCKAFGKLGENLSKYLLKGKQVCVSGFLKQERWEKDGRKESRVVINCEEIQLLGGRDGGQQSNGYGSNNGGYGNDQGYDPDGYAYN